MRRFLQRLFYKPVSNLANSFSSRPDKKRVNKALTDLCRDIHDNPGKKGPLMPFDAGADKFIIFSDQHKGARDGADIFAKCEQNYLAALHHYYEKGFTYINLGDSEELWENLFVTVKRHNKKTFEAEKLFLNDDRFIKLFGNHDLYWDNDPLAALSLTQIYGRAIKVYEGLILKTELNNKPLEILLTHGHQGDLQSDGNWFSKWFVSDVWGPLQGYLSINPNTPAYNNQLKTDHNRMMYEWSSNHSNTLLITGHTHQPVFCSMTHLEILYHNLDEARKENNVAKMSEIERQIAGLHLKGVTEPNFSGYLDSYFNSGCCCFNDGDITGIEIADHCIRLIKWNYKHKISERLMLEECRLDKLKIKR
ncbi:metallophosphoesterase [Mucilaginibacter achroorhodeus]|uniref:Metallophosphoesterase n=1 Tax=Mucilaginibacter achroorhodeus TaxID=2599294 RepID=A0A563UBD6_9SPHI|nr:metallophosphoesterase [Mucilaginibacter achroorhodeus]